MYLFIVYRLIVLYFYLCFYFIYSFIYLHYFYVSFYVIFTNSSVFLMGILHTRNVSTRWGVGSLLWGRPGRGGWCPALQPWL